jgi:hypothetical protein
VLGGAPENLGDNSGFEDEEEDSHPRAASTGQRIDFIDPTDHLGPGSSEAAALGGGGRHPLETERRAQQVTSQPLSACGIPPARP